MMISNDLQQITEQARPIDKHDEMLNRIGQVTRSLHENLKGLGFDKIIEQVSKDIPDACERLNYVSRMTEQSAERVLNATDAAIPLQDGNQVKQNR
jgi:chemotaxis protein CheZ